MDLCLETGSFDLVEFAWEEESAIDPDVQNQMDDRDMKNGIRLRSQIRADRGLEPDGVPDFLMTTNGPVLVADIGKEPEPAPEAPPEPGKDEIPPSPPLPKGGEKLAKAATGKKKVKIKPIDRQRPAMTKARSALKKLFQQAFQTDLAAAAEQLGKSLGLAKAAEDDKIEKLLAELDLAGISATREEAAAILAKAAANGGDAVFVQIGFYGKEAAGREFDELAAADLLTADELAIVNQVNKLAVEWAENRAAELVTKIEESTRDYLRADVTQAVEEGWSTQQLADHLADNFGFSEARSELIARTETAFADCNGNFMAYKSSGVVQGKEWLLGSGHDDDDECDLNADAGVIGLDEAFPSGDLVPPAHPRCVCDFLPVLEGQEAEE
ncbi:MAG: phage head morphogenesis protein [Deltaproteobacteria bacterium]|nr:phage head morphogenesis protein [Deltaproteobacteria bacterium]